MNEDSAKRDEWARIAELLDGRRLTLDREEYVFVVFLGDPWAYEAAWGNEIKQWVPLQRSPSQAVSVLRVRINVYIVETGELKWWDIDAVTFKKLFTCREKYSLDKWVFCIEANDVSNDGSLVEYSILPEHMLDADVFERIQRLQLFEWKDGEALE